MSKYGKLLLGTSIVSALIITLTSVGYAEWHNTAKVAGNNVNLRTSPNTSATIITKLDKGTSVNIIDETDGWYNISFGEKKGWMSADFVAVDPAIKGKILGDNVNLRSSASTSSEVLDTLAKSTDVIILESTEKWARVKLTDGKTGWVYRTYVSGVPASVSRGSVTRTPVKVEAPKPQVVEAAKIEEPAPTGDTAAKADQIIEYAKKFLGVKYDYGKSSPKGFDCSGFSLYVFNHFGIRLERVAASQAGQGKKISKSELKKGDLVFFDTNGGKNHINHVGIYIEGGQFIHSSSGRGRVVISDLSQGFYANAYMTARRFLE